MEVCVDSIESALSAQEGGAVRVELCSNLVEGGTTPSAGLLQVLKEMLKIPVYVMIRPRGGDFLYSEQEFEVMKRDLQILRNYNADGFVFGILCKDGSVDMDRCQELVDLARSSPVTFHRALDMTSDIFEALENVISLGCERVLTSGGENTALEGTPVIRKLVEQSDGRVVVMPGGGITEKNLRRILDETGAKEFHGSGRRAKASRMEFCNTAVSMGALFGPAEFSTKVTDRDRVKSMLSIAREAT